MMPPNKAMQTNQEDRVLLLMELCLDQSCRGSSPRRGAKHTMSHRKVAFSCVDWVDPEGIPRIIQAPSTCQYKTVADQAENARHQAHVGNTTHNVRLIAQRTLNIRYGRIVLPLRQSLNIIHKQTKNGTQVIW
jgi:hypothetical protein